MQKVELFALSKNLYGVVGGGGRLFERLILVDAMKEEIDCGI